MKIQINYDLMDKIRESKTGVSLVRSVRKAFLSSGIVFGIDLPIILMNENKLKVLMNIMLICGWVSCFNIVVMDNLFGNKKLNKYLSLEELKELARILRKYSVNTDYELLQDTCLYETNYSVILDESFIPRLKQMKYMKVLVVDRDGKREVSLVQEHLIGSKKYELSYGSPKKALKPAVSMNY